MRTIYILIVTVLLVSCQEKRELNDQGHTSACWIYAMCTCIEHETARRGDDVKLSREWLMYNELKEQTQTAYLEKKGKVSLRNVGPEVLYLIDHYGLIPHQNDKSDIGNSNVLERKLTMLAQQVTSMQELQDGMDNVMPRFSLANSTYHSLPPENGCGESTFYYFSMNYNPYQFAESVMYYQHWKFYAPSPYHPLGEMYSLEVADNRRQHEFKNLSMQELLPMVIHSLKQGHYVYWELGRRTKDNIVTSNHAMAIIAMKPNGDFVCQNSYGSDWGDKGRCIIKKKDFMEHTCCVGVIE